MPELPEVATIVSQLKNFLPGKKIIDIKILNPKLIKNISAEKFVKILKGRVFKNIRRRAKIIIFDFGEIFVLVHLKLSGRLLYLKPGVPVEKHTHLIFKLSDGYELRFWDLRQFGYFKVFEGSLVDIAELKEFGPEPLEENFTFEKFKELFKGKNKKIKPLLMEQNFIAGIGNIYADEILFYAGVHPLRRAAALKEGQLKKMYEGMRKILKKAIEKRGSSIDDYEDATGAEGGYAPFLKVYGREGEKCPHNCGGVITRIKIGSRSAHFCPICQK